MRWNLETSVPMRECPLCCAPEDVDHTLAACQRGRRWTRRFARRFSEALAWVSKAVGQ